MKLSVIIPTIGRDSLAAAVDSASGADEVIVIENHDNDHGYGARMRGMAQASGTHLAFLDDDDVYAPGAIDVMRACHADRPVIFRMDHPRHGIMWREPKLEFGNVGTPMFLVPNKPEQLGVWEPHMPGLKEPGGDFTFIRGCCDVMGEPIWREEVICIVKPELVRSITIVTAWKDHPELASDYLKAVSFRGRRDELIVVDDASDPPIPFATSRFDENQGFTAAWNEGLRQAKGEAVLFLNNDVIAHSPDWLEPIRELLEPGVFVGGQLRFDPHGAVDGQPMPYLDGWCFAGMTDDLRALGGWDESFDEPAYYGDNDLSFRARLAGITLKEARVPLEHLRNRTIGVPNDPHIRAVTLKNKARFEQRVREELGAAA